MNKALRISVAISTIIAIAGVVAIAIKEGRKKYVESTQGWTIYS